MKKNLEEHVVLIIRCSDGRGILVRTRKRLVSSFRNLREVTSIGAAIPPDIKRIVENNDISAILIVQHFEISGLKSCGGLSILSNFANREIHSETPEELVHWTVTNLIHPHPYKEAVEKARDLSRRLDGVEIGVALFEHLQQRLYPIGVYAGKWPWINQSQWNTAEAEGFCNGVPSLPLTDIPEWMGTIVQENWDESADLAVLAQRQEFANGQSFANIVVTASTYLPHAFSNIAAGFRLNNNFMDAYFGVYSPPGYAKKWTVPQLWYPYQHMLEGTPVLFVGTTSSQVDEIVEAHNERDIRRILLNKNADIHRIILPQYNGFGYIV